ncbi:MAG: hypothetical protein HY869_03685 [Chloroflexi bacterium]|nr:hypothetical protein [Chloroflexota bacterium]
MKLAARIIGILLFLAGAVWFLQGINILPGSFMSGSSQWAVNGGISMLVGAAAFWWGRRRQAK